MSAAPASPTPSAASGPSVGAPLARLEGREKVRGRARYAYEYRPDRGDGTPGEPGTGVAYGWVVQATVPKGRVRAVDADAATAMPGVLGVLWHANAPTLADTGDAELAVLQGDRVAYAGQVVALVAAEDLETAREAARLVAVDVAAEPADTELRPDAPGLYRPDRVNPSYPTDTEEGDPDGALASAPVVVDATYRTPAYHNNPMEPHAATAWWHGDRLTVADSNQGVSPVHDALCALFGLDGDAVRVLSPHVGGGFGSKGTPRPIVVLAALAARALGRPVKLAATRQQMFAFVGYRTPTVQRVRLGAGPDGRLVSVVHDVIEQTSRITEFAEQTAVATRTMYAAAHRRTTHRLARLDVPTPSWMRAPGECPGMYALESAMDELAAACGVDPVELRVRNEPAVDPESGRPYSSRNLVACLREGARRFGWQSRDHAPRRRGDGRVLVGTGVASATYPARSRPSRCAAVAWPDGGFGVSIAAADIGTGARTALTQIAADALGVRPAKVRLELGDSALPAAPVAGGSMGTSSWGWAVMKACRALRSELGDRRPAAGAPVRVEVSTADDVEDLEPYARHAFGAQFAEAEVDRVSGEVRVTRMLGVFAVGRVVNPRTARSQLVGGMTMGLSMALMEESRLDPAAGEWMNKDLADYHVATYADVGEVEACWIDEEDPHLNPMGTKGLGEIGIVGAAAAVANAVWHATGVRVRDLPVRPDRLLGRI